MEDLSHGLDPDPFVRLSQDEFMQYYPNMNIMELPCINADFRWNCHLREFDY